MTNFRHLHYEMSQLKLTKSIFLYNTRFNYPGNGEMIAIGVALENGGEFFGDFQKAHFVQSFKTRADHEMPFRLEVEFAALFSLYKPIQKEEHSLYMKQIFPQAVFPYLREYVAETTRRGGFPPLLINHDLFPESTVNNENDLMKMHITSKWSH